MPCKLDGFVRKRLITVTLWVQFFAMARWKRTSHGSSRKMEMLTEQVCFSEISFGQKRPWAKTPRRLHIFKLLIWWNVPSKTTSAKYPHALRELGWSTWKDVPSSRPNREMAVNCVVRWLADPCEMQGQWFKPVPYMHRSQSQGFGLLKRHLNYHLGFSILYFCWQCLVCLAAFLVFPLGTLKEWKMPA